MNNDKKPIPSNPPNNFDHDPRFDEGGEFHEEANPSATLHSNVRLKKEVLQEAYACLGRAINMIAEEMPDKNVVSGELNRAYGLLEGLLDGRGAEGPNKLVITYYEDCAPVLEPKEVPGLEIELVDGSEIADTFMMYCGVTIYSTHLEKYEDMVSEHWYACQRGLGDNAEDAFDVDDLPDVPDDLSYRFEEFFPKDEHRQKIAYAIEAGLITEDGLQS